jgi:hypothetical protein
MREHAAVWAALTVLGLAAGSPCGTCQNGGLCLPKVEDATAFSCFCPPGWTGEACGVRVAVAVARPSGPASAARPTPKREPLLRVARDPSWLATVLSREDAIDAAVKDISTEIDTLQVKPHTGVVLTAASQSPGQLKLPHILGTFVLTEDSAHPVDSATFASFFPMVLWHTLTTEYVTKDDVKILNVDGPGRKITFEITPSNLNADIPTIENKLKESIADPNSDLRDLLPALDPALSTVTSVDVVTTVPADASGEVHLTPTTHPAPQGPVKENLQNGGVNVANPVEPPAPAPKAQSPGANWEEVKAGPAVPMSTSMRCIIMLTVQFFAIATVVELIKTAGRFGDFPTANKLVQPALTSVGFAPNLAILFLGTRMQAVQFGVEPQIFAQQAMMASTFAVLALTITNLLEAVLADKFGASIAGMVSVLKYIIMIATYGGAGTVVYAVMVMEADPTKFPDGAPPVPPALAATINLLVQYFIIALAYQISDTMQKLKVAPPEMWNKAYAILTQAMTTVNFAPMLSILFIGTRMRALQIDPVNGSPQEWAQTCFYVCAYSVLGQTILVILIPIVTGAEAKPGEIPGDVKFVIPNPRLAGGVQVVRLLLMAAMYIATAMIVYANLTMEHPSGGETPPLSPAMQNVTILVAQFFTVYILQWALTTVRDLAGLDLPKTLRIVVETAQTVVQAPMLSVLFLSARLRAEEMTAGLGQPQGWVQEAMYLSTGALLLKLITICVLGAVGTSVAALTAAVEVLNYIITFALYTGIVVVCVGVMIMEPEVLDGKGGYVWLKMM